MEERISEIRGPTRQLGNAVIAQPLAPALHGFLHNTAITSRGHRMPGALGK